MNWMARIFGWADRLADKQTEIDRLLVENRELRDRLFIKHSLPLSGQDLTKLPNIESITGWKPKRERMKDFLNSQIPLIAPALNDEDLKSLRELSQ
jgi:hypothetical protein